MDARILASTFVTLTLFCATLAAQQAGNLEPAPPTPPLPPFGTLMEDSIEQEISAGPEYVETYEACEADCDYLAPWRLFPQCDGRLNFYGWLNAGFVGNTASPASKFNGPYNAVDRSNELMLNQAYFVAEKKLPSDGCWGIGGRVDMLYGEDFLLAQSVGLELHDDGTPHWNGQYYGLAIPQAYLEFGSTDLSLKIGHAYAVIGYEAVTAPSNFFYTKAYSYQFAGPFTRWGGLATWVPSDRWEFQLGLANGWDTLDREPADNLNYLGKVKYTGYAGGYTLFDISFGKDINNPGALPIANALTNRTRYSWIVDVPVCCNMEYVFHHWLGAQEQGAIGGGTAYWYGIDQYLYYTINDCWKTGLRLEWFRDEDGTRVGLNRPSNPNNVPFVGNFFSVSAGVNWMPTNNFVVRPEIRADWYDGAQPVLPFNDGVDDSQLLFAIDAIFQF